MISAASFFTCCAGPGEIAPFTAARLMCGKGIVPVGVPLLLLKPIAQLARGQVAARLQL